MGFNSGFKGLSEFYNAVTPVLGPTVILSEFYNAVTPVLGPTVILSEFYNAVTPVLGPTVQNFVLVVTIARNLCARG